MSAPSEVELQPGEVWLVGAGPGDPELITRRGWAVLHGADVVVHDRLGCEDLIAQFGPAVACIDVGKRPGDGGATQDWINATLLHQARAGRRVVRLKGGDPFVFGRGFEEAEFLHRHSIRCHVVPGISSSIAGAAAAGIPITHRGAALGVRIATGRSREGVVASPGGRETRVFLMGVEGIDAITANLLGEGLDAATPAAVVMNATTYRQRTVRATLGSLVEAARRGHVEAPALIIVGDVAGLPGFLDACGRRILVTSSRIPPALRRREPEATYIHRPMFRDIRSDAVGLRDSMSADWVVLPNPLAVRHYFDSMAHRGLDLRHLRARLAVLGAEAAAQLNARGIWPDLVASNPRELGAMLGDGGRVIVVGAEGDTGLAGALGLADAELLPAYRLEPVDAAPLDWSAIDGVCFSSRRALCQFAEVHGAAAPVGRLVAWCMGESTARAAAMAGFAAVEMLTERCEEELLHAM